MKLEDLLQNLIDKVENRDNVVERRLDSIDKTLTSQHESLKHHIYRTDLLEKQLEHIEKDVEPIKIHVNRVDGVLKFLGIISLITGIALSFYKMFM